MRDEDKYSQFINGKNFYVVRWVLIPSARQSEPEPDPQLLADAERQTSELIARVKAGLVK